jgi:hypothetical protein
VASVQGPLTGRRSTLLWRAALKRAGELSRPHTRTLGTRSLAVLHGARALGLGLRRFVSCDERQQQLAQAAGLKGGDPSAKASIFKIKDRNSRAPLRVPRRLTPLNKSAAVVRR